MDIKAEITKTVYKLGKPGSSYSMSLQLPSELPETPHLVSILIEHLVKERLCEVNQDFPNAFEVFEDYKFDPLVKDRAFYAFGKLTS